MTHDDPFALPSPGPHSVVGTGLVALDIVIGSSAEVPVGAWAGGTCGNVLSALSFLGWEGYPLARLADDATSQLLCEDMKRWGARLDFVRTEVRGSTPVIFQKIRHAPTGEAIHSFSCRCPLCGSHLPGYKPVLASTINQWLPQLPTPLVFFFDRTSRGALQLAQHYGEQGAMVIFEPSGVGDPMLFGEAITLAHIVKYSQDRMGNVADLQTTQEPLLIIETLGRSGLRYRSRLPGHVRRKWTEVKAFQVTKVLDTAGAGDWCTTGLLHCLGRGGLRGLLHTDSSQLISALQFGQALAAWNCGFEGARGGMYHSTPEQFRSSVRAILKGNEPSHLGGVKTQKPRLPSQRFTCSACQNAPPSATGP